MNQDFWIMRPLNLLFFITFASFVLLLVLASALLHNQSKKTRETVLITACVMTLLGFFVYKYYLSIDSEYNIITAGMGGFNWWGELPLQLCNINMILIPVAVLRNSKPLKCFCFFLALFTGFLIRLNESVRPAACMPERVVLELVIQCKQLFSFTAVCFAQDVAHMELDGGLRHIELGGNFGVAAALE